MGTSLTVIKLCKILTALEVVIDFKSLVNLYHCSITKGRKVCLLLRIFYKFLTFFPLSPPFSGISHLRTLTYKKMKKNEVLKLPVKL